MNLQVVLLSIILNKSISLTRKVLLVLYYIILTWAYIYMKDPVWEEVDLKKIIVLNTACKTVLFHALSHVFFTMVNTTTLIRWDCIHRMYRKPSPMW